MVSVGNSTLSNATTLVLPQNNQKKLVHPRTNSQMLQTASVAAGVGIGVIAFIITLFACCCCCLSGRRTRREQQTLLISDSSPIIYPWYSPSRWWSPSRAVDITRNRTVVGERMPMHTRHSGGTSVLSREPARVHVSTPVRSGGGERVAVGGGGMTGGRVAVGGARR